MRNRSELDLKREYYKLQKLQTDPQRYKLTGSQDFVKSAPLNLVYVADLTKMKGSSPDDQTR